MHDGKTYALLGCSEKNFTSRGHRVWIGIRVFAKILFSAGIALCFDSIKDDWKACWFGKRTIVVYTCSSLLRITTLANRGNAAAQYALATIYKQGKEVTQLLYG